MVSKAVVSAFAVILAVSNAPAMAKEEAITCKLVHHAVDTTQTTTSIEGTGLQAFRNAGVCTTVDGVMFDKKFVGAVATVMGGKVGSYSGFSVYTRETGDALSMSFTGSWGADGNNGTYRIMGGTGIYAGATGDGIITRLKSPWDNTTIMNVRLNIKTP